MMQGKRKRRTVNKGTDTGQTCWPRRLKSECFISYKFRWAWGCVSPEQGECIHVLWMYTSQHGGAGLCPATARRRRWRIQRGTNRHIHRRLPSPIKVHTSVKTIFQMHSSYGNIPVYMLTGTFEMSQRCSLLVIEASWRRHQVRSLGSFLAKSPKMNSPFHFTFHVLFLFPLHHSLMSTLALLNNGRQEWEKVASRLIRLSNTR